MKKIIVLLQEIIRFCVEFLEEPLRNNTSLLARHAIKKLYQTECMIDTGVIITNKKNFFAHGRSSLYHACYILNGHGKFVLGENSHLGAFCYVNTNFGSVIIGNDVAIGPGTKIFSYSNHYETHKKVTEARITADVIVGNNVFIGANCILLPGTVIRDNVVVGAGSIVKGELSSNSVYAGNPLREIKRGWYE